MGVPRFGRRKPTGSDCGNVSGGYRVSQPAA
jgi:hypothetical protein